MLKIPENSRILLVSDLDGTLLGEDREVSEINRLALKEYTDRGGRFTIATGRSFIGIKKFLDILPVNAPVILFNGAVIYDTHKEEVLYEQTLGEGITELVEAVYSNFPRIGIEIFNREGIFLIRENSITKEHRKRQPFSEEVFSIRSVPKPWYKVLFAEEPDKIRKVEAYLKSFDSPFQFLYTEKDMIELVGKGTSKGIALEELASLIGYRVSEAIAIGDNMNDLDMIVKAGTGIAVGNANDEVKAAADLCCCHHDLHAVSQVIGWIKEAAV